jgi:hypothetical protein
VPLRTLLGFRRATETKKPEREVFVQKKRH